MDALARGVSSRETSTSRRQDLLYQLRIVDARGLQNFSASFARAVGHPVKVAVTTMRVGAAEEGSADQTLKVEATPLT